MFNLQGSEIIVILLLALVVLGPEKLPGAIRRFTKTYAELRKMGTSFQDEVKSAFDEPMREVRETADLIKNQVDVDALEAEHDAGSDDDQDDDAGSGDEGGARPTADARPPATAPPSDEPNGGLHESNVLPPPVAGSGRPGPNATPRPPEVPPPPPPFSGSNGVAPTSPADTAASAPDGEEETSA